MSTDKKKPEHPMINRLLKGIHEALCMTIVTREYAHEKTPPSIERILSMLRETGLAEKVDAYNVLRAWHWMKTWNMPAHQVLYHHAVTHQDYDWQNEPSPSGDDVHAWIESYLAYCEGPLLDSEQDRQNYLKFLKANNFPITPENFKDREKSHAQSLQGALHVTPDDVIQTITLCKQWGFTPYNAI